MHLRAVVEGEYFVCRSGEGKRADRLLKAPQMTSAPLYERKSPVAR